MEDKSRCRNWTLVVYPDSAPSDWVQRLEDLHIEWVQSPLHDKDTNADGSVKKAHWHVLLMFGGVKSYEQVKTISDMINAPIPTRCHNARSLVRYFAHLDNPDKHQYSVGDIIPYGGVDLVELLKPCTSERYTLIRDIIQYIKDSDIVEFTDLIDYASIHHYDDWFPLLCDNCAYVVNMYISSNRHRQRYK